jgi:methylmalonyl-CoA mutase C-terminal domain/subunit
MSGNNLQRGKIRVLICVSEIDGHDRGPKYVATSLKNSGMEVIFITYKVIEEVVGAAIQEDVDVIGIGSHTGGHLTTFADLINSLKEKQLDHILVLGGGTIPDEDRPALKRIGVGEVFGPGTLSDKIVDYVLSAFQKTGSRQSSGFLKKKG